MQVNTRATSHLQSRLPDHEPILKVAALQDSTTLLEATGVPLGLFAGASYEKRVARMAQGSNLLIYTDGLTDSILGDSPQEQLQSAMAADVGRSLSNLKALINPKLLEDDITILLAKRAPLMC